MLVRIKAASYDYGWVVGCVYSSGHRSLPSKNIRVPDGQRQYFCAVRCRDGGARQYSEL